jgi:phosphoribosylaminoimidazolecarboxamide formyltransferase/IMP cyclohydrolase
VLAEHGIERFDAVIVNLYAFESVIAKPDCQPAEAIELIDIGGPSLVRAAAKNHAFTAGGDEPRSIRRISRRPRPRRHHARRAAAPRLRRAFEHTAGYDAVISRWMARHAGLVGCTGHTGCADRDGDAADAPPLAAPCFNRSRAAGCRCATARIRTSRRPSMPPSARTSASRGSEQLCGKELSYNNLLDLDGARGSPGSSKSRRPSSSSTRIPAVPQAPRRWPRALATAMAADPTSAFGSIVAVNRTFDRGLRASCSSPPGLFVEVIAAPAFEAIGRRVAHDEARVEGERAARRGAPGRSVGVDRVAWSSAASPAILAQRPDVLCDDPAAWKVVTKAAPPPALTQPLDFAFTIVRRLTSNAIAVCQGTSLVGCRHRRRRAASMPRGSRLEKAGDRASGGVLASDAFFPFPDSIDLIKRAGIAAIIQPGGSKRDPEVIAAADAAGIPMVFTARRHFRH